MSAMCALLMLLTCAQVDQSDHSHTQEVPAVLIDAIKHRESFKTAVFNCRYERDWSGFVPWVRNLELRWANDVLHQIDYGDDDGFMLPIDPKTHEHHIGRYGSCAPEERIFDRSQNVLWGHQFCSPMIGRATVSSSWPDYVDFRTYGLQATEIPMDSPAEFAKRVMNDSAAVTYSKQALEKGLVRVTQRRKVPRGLLEVAWDIDTEKGPEVVCVREFLVTPGGKREFLREMQNTLAQFDGRWWPTEVYGWTADGEKTRVKFLKAEFDRAEHASRIDLDYLGVPVGADIIIQGDLGRQHYVGGGEVVDHATWETRKSNYNLDAFHAYQARARTYSTGEFPAWWEASSETYGVEGVADRPDLWEVYVRRWVIKHTNNEMWRVDDPLTDQQKTGAQGILDDCRKRAVPIRSRLDQDRAAARAELAAFEKEMTSLAATANAESTPRPILQTPTTSQPVKEKSNTAAIEAKASALRSKIASLEKSPEIERLFDELKLRLHGLLTSKQADPASSRYEKPIPPHLRPNRPTSRPAVPSGR